MQISNMRKNKKENNGFTLVELVIVIAGIAALGSFTLPGLLNAIKLNKIEEAKAIMNGYASECLGKFRISTDPADFINNSTPDQLDELKLNTLGFMIDGDKNKCSKLGIKPSDEKENDLYSFDFRITNNGEVIKTGTPSDNPRFLNSCRGWAGKNCGLSPEQQAEFDRLEALAIAKSECDSAYRTWLSTDGTGNFNRWDDDNESCDQIQWAWKGQTVNSEEAYKKARDDEYGDICDEWVLENRFDSRISPDGDPETITECAGENFWFHSGNAYGSQQEWDDADQNYKSKACQNDIKNSLGNTTGEYTPDRYPGIPPCSVPVWICETTAYPSLASYETSSCAMPEDNNQGIGGRGNGEAISEGGLGTGDSGIGGGAIGGGSGSTNNCVNGRRTDVRGCGGMMGRNNPACICR